MFSGCMYRWFCAGVLFSDLNDPLKSGMGKVSLACDFNYWKPLIWYRLCPERNVFLSRVDTFSSIDSHPLMFSMWMLLTGIINSVVILIDKRDGSKQCPATIEENSSLGMACLCHLIVTVSKQCFQTAMVHVTFLILGTDVLLCYFMNWDGSSLYGLIWWFKAIPGHGSWELVQYWHMS